MQWWSLLALADLYVINSPYTRLMFNNQNGVNHARRPSRAMLQACRSRAGSAQPICVPRSDPAAAVPRERAIARLRTALGNVMSIVGSEARARQVRRAHHPRGSFLACAAFDGAGAIASSRALTAEALTAANAMLRAASMYP